MLEFDAAVLSLVRHCSGSINAPRPFERYVLCAEQYVLVPVKDLSDQKSSPGVINVDDTFAPVVFLRHI